VEGRTVKDLIEESIAAVRAPPERPHFTTTGVLRRGLVVF
jgi:hypothetical protein